MSLLREIQNDIARADGNVAALLRKCKILAARLGSREFAEWVKWEIQGYPDSQPIPEYRKLAVTYYASFRNSAWTASDQPIPIYIVPEKYREAFQVQEFHEGIAKAEPLTKDGATMLRPELIPSVQGKIYPQMNCYSVYGRISGGDFLQLISAVKSRILDFVLEIEAANPDAGEAAPNTKPVPDETLRTIVNNFLGPVGNVAQQSHHFSQSASISSHDLTTLVTEMEKHLAELVLDDRQRRTATAQIATLKAQQLAEQPDPVIVAQAGRTLRNITEGAIGSLLATAAQPTVWTVIHNILAHFH
jgi:hypothetical protein